MTTTDPARRFTVAVALACVVAGCGETSSPAPRGLDKPRLVLLAVVDTLRADHLSCYGHLRATSPAIDAFAESSIRFDNAFATTSWTKPSVPSLLTGRLPSGHGVFEGNSRDERGRITSDILTADEYTLAECLSDAGYATGGFVKNAHLKPFLGFAQGFDEYQEGIGDAAAIHRAFLEWLDAVRASDPDRPVFGYVHVLDVHWPYVPAPEGEGVFPLPDIDLDLSVAGQDRLRDDVNDGKRALSKVEQDALRVLYDRCIRGYDARFAALIDALKERGLYDDALIVFTSDHGEEFGERGKLGHGHSLHEDLLRVPLIVKPPAHDRGAVDSRLVSLTDVYPTIARRCGATVPDLVVGKDLLADTRADEVFAELMHGRRYQQAVRTDRWKLEQGFRYLGEPAKPSTSGMPLSEGMRVELKAKFDGEDFEAKRVTLEPTDDDDFELRGPVAAVDADAGTIRVGPLEITVDPAKRIEVKDGTPIALKNLAVGMVVDVDGELEHGKRLIADDVEVRPDKDGRSYKLEGRITKIERADEVDIAGLEVKIDDDAEWEGFESAPIIVKSRVPLSLIGPLNLGDPARFERATRLYRMDRMAEDQDLAKDHADIVEKLRLRLATLRHDGASVGSIELDDATLDELRRIGYLGG